MKHVHTYITRTFLAGLLAALPLLATLMLLYVLFDFVLQWVGPSSALGQALGRLGMGLSDREWVGYVLGLACMGVLLFLLGLLVEKGLQQGLNKVVNAIVTRIPVVSTVYNTLKTFIDLLSKREDKDMGSMQAVWVQFGGPGNVAVLALLSSAQAVTVNGVPTYAVIVPTAPVPIGGGLLYVPVEWVSSAQISMEALTSLYVSMGVTSPQHLPLAKPADPSPATHPPK